MILKEPGNILTEIKLEGVIQNRDISVVLDTGAYRSF